jgi:hypothetical protein
MSEFLSGLGEITDNALGSFQTGVNLLPSALAAGAVSGLVSALIGSPRIIGFLVPDITIREQHDDRWNITKHPVEKGSPVADHAFAEPPGLVMEIAWSDSSDSFYTGRGAYAALQALAKTLEPFFILTGKRIYTNMMIASIAVTTEYKSENALFATVTFEKVNFVVATVTTYPEAAQQDNPQTTAATQETGARQPEPRRQSLLVQGGGLLKILAGG